MPASRWPISIRRSASGSSQLDRSTTPVCWSPTAVSNDYDLGVANRDIWIVTGVRDDGTVHAARLAAEEAAKYEPYVEPRHLDNHDDPAPVSRRRPEPIPTFSRRPGPGRPAARATCAKPADQLTTSAR